MNDDQTVFLVDDDEALRESLGLLLAQAGLRVRAFNSALAFLEAVVVKEDVASARPFLVWVVAPV